jgi:hypothetical protein
LTVSRSSPATRRGAFASRRIAAKIGRNARIRQPRPAQVQRTEGARAPIIEAGFFQWLVDPESTSVESMFREFKRLAPELLGGTASSRLVDKEEVIP